MNKPLLLIGIAISVCAGNAYAQPPGPRGHHDGPPRNPLIGMLDANHDHEVTFEEIEQAIGKLKERDTNGDKKLTREELKDALGPPPRRRPSDDSSERGRGLSDRGRGPEGFANRGRRGDRPRGDHAGPPAERLMAFDKNDDGKLAKDEVPERVQRLVEKADTNDDGFADEEELNQLTAKMKEGADARGRFSGRRGDDRPRFDREDGEKKDRAGRPGRPVGPPSPERMVEHAFEFDADHDGMLSKSEFGEFAKRVAQFRRPGGDGGDRPERGESGRRPGRPQRGDRPQPSE